MSKKGEYKNKYRYLSKTFTIGFDENGKRIRKKVRGKTQAELNRKYKEAKELYEKGLDPRLDDITVAEWAALWLENYKKPNISDTYYNNLVSLTGKHIVKPLGAMSVKDVKEIHLQSIVNGLKGKSKSLTVKVMRCIKDMFTTAHSNGLTIVNPTTSLRPVDNVDGEREPLSKFEREIVLRTAFTHPEGLMLLIMLYCGLRRGEVLPLTLGDIDLETGFLDVNKAVEFPANKAKLKDTTKTKAGMRKVFIVPILLEELEKRVRDEVRKIISEMPDIVPDRKDYINEQLNKTLLFPMSDGGIRSKSSYRKLWENFQREMESVKIHLVDKSKDVRLLIEWEQVNVKEITAHRLRHTFATDLLEAGVQDRAIKYLMGHAQPDITGKYAKVMSKTLNRAFKLYCEQVEWDKNGTNRLSDEPQSIAT